jgi:DnaJ-class molecular chaperone
VSDYDPNACPPCRGTGSVISSEGGEAHQVTCPWCGGTGRRPAPAPASDQ